MSEQERGRGKREAGAVVAMATRRGREDGLERASVTVLRITLINVVVAYFSSSLLPDSYLFCHALTLIGPGEVKVDLADFVLKLQENLLSN
jgi:hypothetical protein